MRAEPQNQAVALLPFDVIEIISQNLTVADKSSLALTHPVFRDHFRITRTKCLARVDSARHLKQLSASLVPHQLESLHCRILYDRPSLRNLSYLPPSTTSLSFAFLGIHPKHMALSALGSAQQFSNITRLTLEGSNERTGWLNRDGSLSALSNMHNLRHLSLVKVGSDRGLDQLTQASLIFFSTHWVLSPNHLLRDNLRIDKSRGGYIAGIFLISVPYLFRNTLKSASISLTLNKPSPHPLFSITDNIALLNLP